MGNPSISNSGLTIAGLVIFLVLFGAVLGISFYTLFYELRDVKNRLETLEKMVHVAGVSNTYTSHNKVKRDAGAIQHSLVTESAQTCCISLAHPSFLNDSTSIQNLTVTAKETVILDCRMSGYPFPTVNWKYDNIAVEFDSERYSTRNNNQEYVINQVRVVDSGMYSCKVTNVLGEKEKYVDLRVYEPSSVSVHPQNITLEESSETNVSIVCTVWGNPKPIVTWYYQERNGENRTVPAPVNTNTYPQTSTLDLVHPIGTDSGRYVCAASNDFEQKENSSILTVLSQPYIVDHYNNSELVADSGDFVVLRCNTIGAPTPDITWIWKKINGLTVGAHIDGNNGSLILGHVNTFNSGEYECSASNSYGTTTASVNLIIKVDVYTEVADSTIPVNQQAFALQCSVKGNPTPNVEWTRNSQHIFGATYLTFGKTLVISPGNRDVTGIYTCIAKNRFSSHQSQIVVYHNEGTISCTQRFDSYYRQHGSITGGNCSLCDYFSVVEEKLIFNSYDRICESAHRSDMESPSGFIFWYPDSNGYYKILKWDAPWLSGHSGTSYS